MSETGWIALVVISVVLVVGTIAVCHDIKLSDEATKIREGCEATTMYTIDSSNRVIRIYDCGEE